MRLLLIALLLLPTSAMAQSVSKGSVQRHVYDNLNSADFTATDDISVGDDLTVTDDATISGDLSVSGTTTPTTLDLSSTIIDEADGIFPDATCTITAAANSNHVTYLSASGESQTCTLPDGGTATDAVYKFTIYDAPSGNNTITIQVPSGDNSTFAGRIDMMNETDTIIYGSAASSGADTLTFSSDNTENGDTFTIISGLASTFYLEGGVQYESVGADNILIYSSAVTSTD